jgi:hypothetical protein
VETPPAQDGQVAPASAPEQEQAPHPWSGAGEGQGAERATRGRHPWLQDEDKDEDEAVEEAPALRLGGKQDPLLAQILEEELGPTHGSSGLRIEDDGWVRGRLDPRRISALLERFALLHVLKQDARNWYWFWAVDQEAQEIAERSGLPMDLAGEAD